MFMLKWERCRLGCSQAKAGKNISIFGTRVLIFNLEINGSIGKYESFSVVKEGNNADLLLSKCQVAVHQGLLLCEMPCLPIDKQKRVLCSCSQCNGIKLTPARFESHTGSRRKNWKLIIKVKGTDIKLDDRKCVICEQVHGACTKCCKCNVYYHAICASRAGYRMELHTYVSHGKQISRFDSYCPNHGDVNKSNALVLAQKK